MQRKSEAADTTITNSTAVDVLPRNSAPTALAADDLPTVEIGAAMTRARGFPIYLEDFRPAGARKSRRDACTL